MSEHDNNRKPHNKDRAAKTLAEKVRAVQERARREGLISDDSTDKQMMDEAWGEHEESPERPIKGQIYLT